MEFTRLPDEFNRDAEEPVAEETRKPRMNSWVISFAAVVMLVLPLTVNIGIHLASSHPHDPVIPVDPDPPVVIVDEYEIKGLWTNGEEYYNFLEDGNGYYYNGRFFCLFKWEKSGNDYRYWGGGVSYYDANTIEYFSTDSLTVKQGDGVLLYSEREVGTPLFHRTSETINDSFVMTLVNTTLAERAVGFWECMNTIREQKVAPSYLKIDTGGRASTDAVSTIENKSQHYEFSWRVDEKDSSYCHIMLGDGETLTFSTHKGNYTYNYEDAYFIAYYFIEEERDGLIFDIFSGRHILERYDF